MNAVVLLALYVLASLSQAERGVIVDGPLHFEAVPALTQLTTDRLAKSQAIWVWSPIQEPRRFSPDELQREGRRWLGSGHSLLVRVPAARREKAGSLRLIAAPVEMWSEAPEPLLPSWPLPRSGRLTISTDGSRAWRLRVAGEKSGSFWMDLPAGAPEAILSVVPAPGSHFVVVGDGERTVAGSSVRVSENSPGRTRGARSWAFLIGDEKGRFALPGLPDRSELRWLAAGQGHPPKLVVSAPSRLAKIVLADGATVTGRLVDPGGHPVAGAAAQVEAWFSADAPIPFTVNTQTDSRGRFTASAVPPGRAMLVAVNRGWAPLRLAIEVPREGLDLGRLALSRGDSLAVHVVNDAGEPVAGAEVRPDLGEAATTGPDGLATLTHLPESAGVRVVATAKGHVRSETTVLLPARRLELRLERAFAVSGRFLGADSSPLGGAAVKVARGKSFDTAPVDPDGTFFLTLRPDQEYILTFTSPRSAYLEVPVPAGAPGEERDLGELRALAASRITGRLVDSATGNPVPGGRVWCPRPSAQGPVLAWMGGDLLEATSGPDGTFHLEGGPPGVARLRIEAAGFARAARGVQVPTEGNAELGDVPLSRGTTLVVTAGPKGEGAVAVVDVGGEGLPFDRLSAPVVEGVARVEQVAPGAAKVAVARGSSVLCEKTLQVPAGAAELSVECSAEGVSVRGVVTLGGRPAGSGALLWETAAGPLPEGVMTFSTPSGLTQQQVFTANAPPVAVPVEAGGAFASRELRAGRWQVTFEPEGGGSTEALEVALSEEKDQALVLPYPGFSVSGTVLDGDGQTVEKARVRDLEGGTTTLSAKDGSFRFDGLRAKTYYFRAAKGDAASEADEVAVGEDQSPGPLVLVLRPEGSQPAVEIRVADERGAPVPGAFVFIEIPGRGLRVLTADSTGTAKLVLDPPYPASVRAAAYVAGKWALGAWQPFEQAREGMTLAVGPTGSMGVEAGTAAGLVEIAGPGGWNMTLLLSTLGARPLLDPGAVLEVGGLPPGTYELKAGERVATATVREGQRAEVGFAEN